MILLDLRIHSLKRRAGSLQNEIDQWLYYAEKGGQFEKNFSQLQALKLFMNQINDRLIELSSKLNSTLSPNTDSLLCQACYVEEGIFKANYIWSYFRSKLEQRFIPRFADALYIADLISNDCYRTIIRNADKLGIKHNLGLRDYPLTYFSEDFSSPVTWPRSMQLKRLDYRSLPLPIIGIPWDHATNPWELLSIHHEVSHDVDVDLNEPSLELGIHLEQRLIEKGIPKQRANFWRCWISEIFADFLGILLGGPSFISFLACLITLPQSNMCLFTYGDPHPPPYLRILMNIEFARRINLDDDVHNYINNLHREWIALYGMSNQEVANYIDDLECVIETVLLTKLNAFKDNVGFQHSLFEIADFSANDFRNQINARDHILSNKEAALSIPIRHIIGAAYMAIEMEPLEDNFAETIVDKMNSAIRAKAPVGQLAIRSNKSREHLKKLANSYFDTDLSLIRGNYDQAIC